MKKKLQKYCNSSVVTYKNAFMLTMFKLCCATGRISKQSMFHLATVNNFLEVILIDFFFDAGWAKQHFFFEKGQKLTG